MSKPVQVITRIQGQDRCAPGAPLVLSIMAGAALAICSIIGLLIWTIQNVRGW